MKKIIQERLVDTFVAAKYGYWIKPDGTILNVDKYQGHSEVLQQQDDFNYLSPRQSLFDWYEEASNSGWIRVIAVDSDTYYKEFSFQIGKLTKSAKRTLIGLIKGLPQYKRYVYESLTYQIFDDIRDCVRFVSALPSTGD